VYRAYVHRELRPTAEKKNQRRLCPKRPVSEGPTLWASETIGGSSSRKRKISIAVWPVLGYPCTVEANNTVEKGGGKSPVSSGKIPGGESARIAGISRGRATTPRKKEEKEPLFLL